MDTDKQQMIYDNHYGNQTSRHTRDPDVKSSSYSLRNQIKESEAYRLTLKKKKPLPKIPKCANYGFSHYPACINLLFFGTFFGVVCATTPFWARINSGFDAFSSFGLWHYCRQKSCTSIHDNLIQGRSVPALFHFIQGTFCIGTVMCFTGLGILVSNFYGKKIKMTVTTHRAACCVLGISVFQQFVSLYAFASFFEDLNFLYFADDDVDFYGSFYCGIVSFVLTLFACISVYMDEGMTKMNAEEYKELQWGAMQRKPAAVTPIPYYKEHQW